MIPGRPGKERPAKSICSSAFDESTDTCTIQKTEGALSERCGSLASMACPVAEREGATTQLFEPVNPSALSPIILRAPSIAWLNARAATSASWRSCEYANGATLVAFALPALAFPALAFFDIVDCASFGKASSGVTFSSGANLTVSTRNPARGPVIFVRAASTNSLCAISSSAW